MKIAIISTQYPSDKNHYAHTFVHRRSLYFIDNKIDVEVFVPNKSTSTYFFDNVKVNMLPAKDICNKLDSFDLVYFHLLNLYPFSKKNGKPIYDYVIENSIKAAFYIHGSEVQSLRSRNFDFNYNALQLARVIYKDYYFMPKMRRIVGSLIDAGSLFITPSKWMLEEARTELKLHNLKADIIPNGIDTVKFSPLHQDVRCYKMLMIRPLNSNKYAVDVGIKLIAKLPKEYTLDIYGKGPKKKEFVDLIKALGVEDRVEFVGDNIPNKEMPDVMSRYKIFLSPTRMDAQGVTMCEAMSCGLTVISSKNTAIPEFIEDGISGILIDNDDIEYSARKVLDIINCEKKTYEMGVNARKFSELLSFELTLKKEMESLISMVNK